MRYVFLLLLVISAAYGDVIYDDQTYDLGNTWNAYYFVEGLADDFETDDYYLLTDIRFWAIGVIDWDVEVTIFDNDDDDDPGDELFNETVSYSEVTWTDTGDDFSGYPVYQVDVPITGFEIISGTRYWLCIAAGYVQSWWLVMPNQYDWWENCHIYYWTGFKWWWDSEDFYGEASACEFELYGASDYVDPTVTDTFPHDGDYPSGVPVDVDITFHVTDDDSGCDTGETTCSVETDGEPLSGTLGYDDGDPLDVAFTWDSTDDFPETATIDVTVETYDNAGNGPVLEEWSFTTCYVNVSPASLGEIKAGFTEYNR